MRPSSRRLIWLFLLSATLPLGAQARKRDADWSAPAGAAARSNPIAGRMDLAAGGRKLFRQRCASCHGADGRGTPKAPDLAEPDIDAQADGVLFWKITQGNARTGMPAFSSLPEPQRWQLVLHLRSLLEGAAFSRKQQPGSF